MYSAIFGEDWNLTSDSVTFGLDSIRECFNVTILEDDVFELVESFYISISETLPPININETTSGASIQDITAGACMLEKTIKMFIECAVVTVQVLK